MIINGMKISTYSEFNRHFRYFKSLTLDEAISELPNINTNTDEKVKKICQKKVKSEISRWPEEYKNDNNIMVVFLYSVYLNNSNKSSN